MFSCEPDFSTIGSKDFRVDEKALLSFSPVSFFDKGQNLVFK